jgi:hypothetical protein
MDNTDVQLVYFGWWNIKPYITSWQSYNWYGKNIEVFMALNYVKLEVQMAVTIYITIFWDAMPHILINVYKLFKYLPDFMVNYTSLQLFIV